MKSRPLLTIEEVLGYSAECFAGDKTNTLVHGALDLFLEKHGREGAERVMLDLCFLIVEVRRIAVEILAEQEAEAEAESCANDVEPDQNAVTQKLRRLD